MKKITGKILAGTLALGCVCTAAGCNFFGWTMNDVKDSLKDNKYVVSIEKDADVYGYEGIVEKYLYAYEEKKNENYEDANYFCMYEFKSMRTAKLYYDMRKSSIENRIEEAKAQIALYEYVVSEYKRDIGSTSVESIKDSIEELEDEIEEAQEQLENMGKKGVYVWFGTSDGISDAFEGV